MGKLITALIGLGSFLLGAGLQVSGVTNFWVGIVLMILGGTCVAVALAGPPTGRRLSLAIVQTGVRHLELPPAPSPPPDLSPLRETIQRMAGELRRNARLLREAIETQRYWLPSRQVLLANEWAACYTTLARYDGFESTFEHARAAYDECDRVNHLVGEQLYEKGNPTWRTVRKSDRIDEALEVIAVAIAALDSALETIRERS